MPDQLDNSEPQTKEKKQAPARPRSSGKLPVFKFVFVMLVLLIGFNWFFYEFLSNPKAIAWSVYFDGYLAINAETTAAFLRYFGEQGVTVDDVTIRSPRFSLGIKRGCDAIQPAAFFAFFVAASPVLASRWKKAKAIAIGIAIILLINLIRLLSLYYVGANWRSVFEWFHVEFWQMVFIAIPIVFWLFWARKQQMKGAVKTDAKS